MLKNVLLIFLSLIIVMSCKKENATLEDDYISQIEREYTGSTNEVILEADDFAATNNRSDNFGNDGYNRDNRFQNTPPPYYAPPQNNVPQAAYTPPQTRSRRPIKATVDTFYSPWTSKNDPLLIREIRVMIANKEYTRARNYIEGLNLNNLPANVDLGQIYQFKGIVHYFLAKNNPESIAIADESFKNVMGTTRIEKFKPLSLLWNGMLYQTYSYDPNELQAAVGMFDRIISEYPSTRFANDAVFYKAMTLKKMGKQNSEYKDLFLMVKRGGFSDTLVFSQTVNDYVQANSLVDRELITIN